MTGRTGQSGGDIHPGDLVFLRGRLLRWFKKNARDYPWRQTKSPWRVLIAEMMLQRTRADQVHRVYREFFRRFRNPRDVAQARRSVLHRILKPLGLSWRVSNVHDVARVLVRDHRGRVPESRELLKTLPGVGDYVAGAVLSVGFGMPEWIVDVNVVRVYRRFLGITTSKEGRRDRAVVDLARIYSLCREPRRANLALLDFSAAICQPGRPCCDACPVKSRCRFFAGLKRRHQYQTTRKGETPCPTTQAFKNAKPLRANA